MIPQRVAAAVHLEAGKTEGLKSLRLTDLARLALPVSSGGTVFMSWAMRALFMLGNAGAIEEAASCIAGALAGTAAGRRPASSSQGGGLRMAGCAGRTHV